MNFQKKIKSVCVYPSVSCVAAAAAGRGCRRSSPLKALRAFFEAVDAEGNGTPVPLQMGKLFDWVRLNFVRKRLQGISLSF